MNGKWRAHHVQKPIIGIEQQNPSEGQGKIRDEEREPAKKFDGVAARHIGAGDQPGENHRDHHCRNQTHSREEKTHPQRIESRTVVKRAQPIVGSINSLFAGRRQIKAAGEQEQQRQAHRRHKKQQHEEFRRALRAQTQSRTENFDRSRARAHEILARMRAQARRMDV